MRAIEAIAQKMLDFRSTVTSCLVWVTSCHARTLTLTMSDLKVHNNNQYSWFFDNELEGQIFEIIRDMTIYFVS